MREADKKAVRFPLQNETVVEQERFERDLAFDTARSNHVCRFLQMLARTLFNQMFLLKPSQSSLSILSVSHRAINTAARVTEHHIASLVRIIRCFCLVVEKGTEHTCCCSSSR